LYTGQINIFDKAFLLEVIGPKTLPTVHTTPVKRQPPPKFVQFAPSSI
jgi:hypothetical protein